VSDGPNQQIRLLTDPRLRLLPSLAERSPIAAVHTVPGDPQKIELELARPVSDQVVIDYLELKKSSFFDQVTVKDEDLQAAYQKETANLAEQRRAAHILIEVNDKVTDAQAKAKIEEIQARLAKGEKFEALARSFPRIQESMLPPPLCRTSMCWRCSHSSSAA